MTSRPARYSAFCLSVISAALIATSSQAEQGPQSGDWTLRAGLTSVQPRDNSGEVYLDGAPLGSDSGVTVGNDTQLGITVEYHINQNWGVELLAATPFEHSVSSEGSTLASLGINKVADVTHLPPTLSAIYHFDTQNALKPYVGLGINYTVFFSEDASSELENALGDSSVSLDNSLGLSAQIGVDYHIDNTWSLNASARYIDLNTKAKITTAAGTVSTSVDINPMVYTLSMGYRL